LHGADIHERLLDRMKFTVRGKTLDRDDLLSGECADFALAGTDGRTINEHGAGAAFALAAALFGAREINIVAQDAEQRAVGIHIHRNDAVGDMKFVDVWHVHSSRFWCGRMVKEDERGFLWLRPMLDQTDLLVTETSRHRSLPWNPDSAKTSRVVRELSRWLDSNPKQQWTTPFCAAESPACNS